MSEIEIRINQQDSLVNGIAWWIQIIGGAWTLTTVVIFLIEIWRENRKRRNDHLIEIEEKELQDANETLRKALPLVIEVQNSSDFIKRRKDLVETEESKKDNSKKIKFMEESFV